MKYFKILENRNTINVYTILIFFISSYFLYLNFINESGYWYDEWCTLLTSDPNVDLKTIYERFNGNSDKPYENVPIIYYLVLRFFFNIFGYTSENGRIFSLFFLIFSSISFYFLLQLFLKKRESLFATSIFFSTPLIIWMSNETRVDLFLVFFVLLNMLIFFLTLKFNRLNLKILLLTINVITLSVYPLTLSIIGSQILFLLIQKYLDKSKNFLIIGLIILSVILYFFLNFEYFLERSMNRDHHFAKLNLNFFLLYYFNIFFGSVFFGLTFFILCIFFLFHKRKYIIKDQLLLFCIISIFLTYLMIIISTIFITPIAAPRYIIFIIPIILMFIFKCLFNYKYKNFFFLLLFCISIVNISINYDNRHIKKPHTAQALNLIKEKNFYNIIVLPKSVLFQNYISTISDIKYFNLFTNFEDIKNNDLKNFAILCLYKPRYAGDKYNKYEYCNQNYIGFENFEEIKIPDYKVIFFNKLNEN